MRYSLLVLAFPVCASALRGQAPCYSAALATPGASNNCSLTAQIELDVNAVAQLSISTSTTSLTAPKASDFGSAAGVTNTGPTVTVKANATYTLTASAATTNWQVTNGATKPASDLKMKVGAGSFVSLGTVSAGAPATTGANYDITYNTVYNWITDKPGTYSLVVNYTLSAP